MSGVIYSPDCLPNEMIGLATKKGQELLQHASIVNTLMVERSSNQMNRTYCGPASLAVVCNGINVGSRIHYMTGGDVMSSSEQVVTEDDIVNSPSVKEYLTNVELNVCGVTLQQLEDIICILGFGVNTYFACGGVENDKTQKENLKNIVKDESLIFQTCEEFTKVASSFIKRPVTGVIVNYDMSVLGYSSLKGHFSPLAAYDKGTDMFLVMDVWPDTPAAWVKAELLFKAMCSLDGQSMLPRGLLHIHELL